MTNGERVAIVGLAGRYPGSGADLDAFWANVAAARDCSRDAPPAGRWVRPPADCIDPTGADPDGVPHARGYYLDDFALDAAGLDLPGDMLAALDPLFHLVLDVGSRAWRAANTANTDRRKVGVILGNICLPTAAASALARDVLGPAFGLPKPPPTHKLNQFVAGLPAGLLARGLGLGGGTFTLDAACASSLYALKLAADELLSGRADAMLAGGVNRADSQYTQTGFARLKAASASGRCSPFDAAADGLMVGEGAGVFVLKRLSDAVRDGDTVHAVLAGWGLSNDIGANLLSPAAEGQLRAMRAAYRRADWSPADVSLVECHATGTPVGDAVEFDSLSTLLREAGGSAVIGSVKSTVGHLLTGAGAAAVTKTIRALAEGVLPPQANFTSPGANLRYSGGPLRVLREPEAWPDGRPRRAAVSGFGFGGVNAHLLFETVTPATLQGRGATLPKSEEPIAIVGMAAHVGRADTLAAFQHRAFGAAAEPAAKAVSWDAAGRACPPGHYIDELRVPLDRFRIPPKELEGMLPQQLLMLHAAADAIADCGTVMPDEDPAAGVFVGLGLDPNTTNFHLRWAVWAAGGDADAASPPLSADRVMGALGSIAASRIARLFRLGGPSFTCCSEQSSSGRAVELAVRALRAGELDRAIVGGVDLTGDPRTADDARPLWADAAAAVVLKRLADAERDGDRVYAVIRGVGSASGGGASGYAGALLRACGDANAAPGTIGYLDAAGGPDEADALAAVATAMAAGDPPSEPERERGPAERSEVSSHSRTPRSARPVLARARAQTELPSVGDREATFGHAGFASGLVGVVKAALALYHEIRPAADGSPTQYWLKNEGEPRRALVASAGIDGSFTHVVLDEPPSRPTPDANPLGPRPEAVVAVEGDTPGELLDALGRLLAKLPADGDVAAVARDWHERVPASANKRLAVALVPRSVAELREQAEYARASITARPESPLPEADPRPAVRDRVFYAPFPLGRGGKLALVFPGSGNQFAGMGRDLGVRFPAVLRRQQTESARLRSQYAPHLFWADMIPPEATPRDFLFGQVTVGTLTADLLAGLGIRFDAMIGQSLGESAGLFGTRVWASRDEMYERVQTSSLFGTDLGPPYDSARQLYHTPAGEPLDWVTGVIPAAPDEVRAAADAQWRAYVLIVTTPDECVIGGLRADVEQLVAAVGRPFLPLAGVTLAHCEAGRPVEKPYRELHTLPVSSRPGLTVYSGAWGRPYEPTTAICADSITAGLVGPIDFPRVVEAAYRDGVRLFVEAGPGNSASRMIAATLGKRPHLARPVCVARQDSVSLVHRLAAALIAERVPVDLAMLHPAADERPTPSGRVLVLPAGCPARRPAATPQPIVTHAAADLTPIVVAAADTQAAATDAHAAFLRVQDGLTRTALAAVQLQTDLVARLLGRVEEETPVGTRPTARPAGDVPRSLSFDQCMTFAVGRIADALGPQFAEVDAFPTRVRLPDGPLMLVDRVLSIDGEPKSLTRGRVVTEHTVRPDRWYLDSGRCPTSVTVESGQADLFLSGFLGIDFHTRGLAVYRLLDAVVTFHRALPRVGERIEYDIHIDEFFRQADAWLFRFRFEGTIDGQPLLSMKSGVAGFFTAEALAAGQGIVHTKLDRQAVPGKKPDDWRELVAFEPCSLDADAVEALRRGELAAAFGPRFENLPLRSPMKLPGGMLRLVDRVPTLDAAGGRFGLGFVRAEYDIRPAEWFIECHFVDDKVMPGTLMYECCLHTLRILLMRRGWVGEAGTVCEPVPGVNSRLKCRGQVLQTTGTVAYEVSVKEIGYRPEPYAIADALMFADGKPIVEITNLSLRMTGLSREAVESLWGERPRIAIRGLYGPETIRAFAVGNPSDAFGEPYRVFDRDRVIARLPGPPYQFLDRVVDVAGEPFVLAAGASCVAEYDVPAGEWYFAANRCEKMPFSVLLEVALQPCGWLAAYCGSALTSDQDLSFRNLGGKATQHRAVGPDAGTLRAAVTMTNVSSSAGMIIQHYTMSVSDRHGPVYDGTTYFGFFAKDALRNQVGMPAAKVPYLTDDQRAFAEAGVLPHDPPFPDAMLRMVDRIDGYLPRGGRAGLGLVQGRIAVDAGFWFFKAHFHQDPVWPGSLGLESFLQLLKYVAWKKWGAAPPGGWQTTAPGVEHRWTYRGQVLPADREVVVVLEVTGVDQQSRRLTADGFLTVDGRVIYQMTGFTLE